MEELRQFCISKGGLLNNDIRRRVYPILLNVNDNRNIRIKNIKKHKQFEQIQKDVERSMYKFNHSNELERDYKRQQLFRIINNIILDNNLHYFQGFHDICEVFLLICGESLSFKLLQHLIHSHLR